VAGRAGGGEGARSLAYVISGGGWRIGKWTPSPRERRTRRTADMDVLMLIVVFIIGHTPNWLLNLIF
jgi:hypothetical protein